MKVAISRQEMIVEKFSISHFQVLSKSFQTVYFLKFYIFIKYAFEKFKNFRTGQIFIFIELDLSFSNQLKSGIYLELDISACKSQIHSALYIISYTGWAI